MSRIQRLRELTPKQAERRLRRLLDEGRFQPAPKAVRKLRRRGLDLMDVESAIRAGRVLGSKEKGKIKLYVLEGVSIDGVLIKLVFDLHKHLVLEDLE